jgi:ribosomal protection tetracycline resistance protein
VSFVIDDVTVNLIDTPGHPDFIAEVERVLNVLDGAVLVVSAVEGVQAQTRILMRTLQRLGIPTLIFVNKIDRGGATYDEVLRDIAERLTNSLIAMGAAHDLGTRGAGFTPFEGSDAAFAGALADVLANHDETILAAYVDGSSLSGELLRSELVSQIGRALVYPVLFGSAMTGAGVDELTRGIVGLLPSAAGDEDAPLSATVFKIERGPDGEKVAHARLFSGRLRTRERVRCGGDEHKVTAIHVFEGGNVVQRSVAYAGQIAKLWGLGGVRIGDEIGAPRMTVEHHFDPPSLETVVVPRRSSERGTLFTALAQLAEQDPLINLRQDDLRHELSVSLYGEVQKEVIEATLAEEYHVEVGFRETTMICVERPTGTGEAIEPMGGDNPFLATVGMRIEPAPVDSGIAFELDVALETIPLYVFGSVDEFRSAVDGFVRQTLREGLHGWQVTDCAVWMTHCGYDSPGTGASDFRYLTPLVLMRALQRAGTSICEPVHRFGIEVPSDTLGGVLRALAGLDASPRAVTTLGSSSRLDGEIAAVKVRELQQRLPGLSRGESVLETTFDHYRSIRGAAPSRPRAGPDPRNRDRYLMRVLRGL